MGTVTRSALLKSLERAIDRADIHARSAIQHKETYERAKARDHKGDRAIAANNLWRHREALRWSREFLADAEAIRADLEAMDKEASLFEAAPEAQADDFEAAIMAGEVPEWKKQETEALPVPRPEPRSAETPSITESEREALIKADERKGMEGVHRGMQYLLIPDFNRLGDPWWLLKCRQGSDNNADWDRGWAAFDTLAQAMGAAKDRINTQTEHFDLVKGEPREQLNLF